MSNDVGAQPSKDGQAERPRHRLDRLRMILQLVDTDSTVSVDELAHTLEVSTATVRRDLAQLDYQGQVVRSRGGAMRVNRGYEMPIRHREMAMASEKKRIAAMAARLVSDATVVGVTGGTTTMEVTRALAGRQGLTVVTNALNIGAELAVRANIRLVVTGGIARPASFELSGPVAERTIKEFNIDIAFIGADGLSPRAGVTTHNDWEALTNTALVSRAATVVAVVDSTKLGQVKFARICDLQDLDLVITDTGAAPDQVSAITAAGVEVRLA